MSPPITASITLTMTKTKISSKAGEVPKRRDLVHRTYVHSSSVWKLEANLPIITIFLGNCDIFVVQFDPWSYLELMKNCPLLALPIGSDGKRMKSGFWEIDVDWLLYEFFGRLPSAAIQLDKNNNQSSSSRQDENTPSDVLYNEKEEFSSALKPVDDNNHDTMKSKRRSEFLYFLPSFFSTPFWRVDP